MAESEKRIRVLYVCPWAHLAGHTPQAATKEPLALLEAGVEVSICTFRGILDQKEPQVISHRSVVSSKVGFPLGILAQLLNSMPKGRYFARFLEQVSTLYLAVKLRKPLKYDVIYLRDGDPFIFIPFVLGMFLKDYRWACSLLGSKPVRSPNSLFHKFINAPIWKPVYLRAFSKNRFAFICEGRCLKDYFETKFLDGILSGRISVVPLGVKRNNVNIAKRKARQYLGLPQDKAVFLHFGTLHPDKDIETVLAAINSIPDALLVHAGQVWPWAKRIQSVNSHSLQNNVIIRDCYIPELEKQYYFAAADAIILSYKGDFLSPGSTLWEAAKFKLPVIASDVGELGELTKRYNFGLVFAAENAASLKGVLFDFLNSSHDQRDSMVNNYEYFYHDFSIDTWAYNCVKVIMELYGHASKEN